MSERLVYGLHPVASLIQHSPENIHCLYINKEKRDQRLQKLLEGIPEQAVTIEKLTAKAMQQRFADHAHQGIVAILKNSLEYNEKDLLALLQHSKAPVLILILDSITDPHNLGACLRTAEAAGVDFVLIPKDKSVGLTGTVSKVASGAAEIIPLVKVTNLARAMEKLKEQGVWLYGAAGEAEQSLFKMTFSGHMAIVMGAEGKGLRRLTREHCDELFSLPMLGTVESLNVSVATGISLYEVVRQRQGAMNE